MVSLIHNLILYNIYSKNVVNGSWIGAESGKTFAVTNPMDGKVKSEPVRLVTEYLTPGAVLSARHGQQRHCSSRRSCQ